MRLLIGNKNYSSWSLRPWLLLCHFGIKFTEEMVLLNGPDWKKILNEKSPTGRVPVLYANGIKITETLAIIEYLAERFPEHAVWPKDVRARALARAASAEMHAGFGALRDAAPMNLRASHPGRVDVDRVASDLKRLEILWGGLLDQHEGPFLFGPFCAADAMFAPLATRIRTYALPVSEMVQGYVNAIYALPAFQAWLGDAVRETWVVEQDEIDFIQAKAE